MSTSPASSSLAGLPGKPYNHADFERMGVLELWRRYSDRLTWGKGQTLAILDDGCDLTVPQWRTSLPWGPKVIAGYNVYERNDDPTPVPPGYHGTSQGYPSSLNHEGVLGVAYNDHVAQVRCITIVHLTKDETKTIADGLQWVIDNHKRHNITAVNLSALDDLEHTAPVPTCIDAPLRRLRELDIWVSSPCGNHNYTKGISWPACQEYCYGIGGSKAEDDSVHLDRFANTDILVPATATSSSNAYILGGVLILREAIEKAGYAWKSDGPTLPEAMMAIFLRTGTRLFDPATGLHFQRLDLLKAVEHVFAKRA
ncbi:MAG: hypothetical protein NTW19_02830 [Planctomycetota bacterium]|nr:hypothetical protein [Planctomycetota bacterium]